jgi:hypothetical protein
MRSDSLSLQVIESGGERAAFAVLARASGEKEHADLAGATAVKLLRGWFSGSAGHFFGAFVDMDPVVEEIRHRMLELRGKVRDYRMEKNVGLQVDVAAALFAGGSYHIIGFEGIYAMKLSPEGNGLLYLPDGCPGSDGRPESEGPEPVSCSGEIRAGDAYLLYTEEIGKMYGPEELYKAFPPGCLRDPLSIRMRMSNLVENCGHHCRTGNASAMIVRFWEG